MAPAAGDGETLDPLADGNPNGDVEDLPAPADDNTDGTDDGGEVISGEGEEEGVEDPAEEEETPEAALARAQELFEIGSKAVNSGDFLEAVDCLSQALELRVGHYGELAEECASSYYKYGCALLCKAQEEADPLVAKPSNAAKNKASSGGDSGASSSKGEGQSSSAMEKTDPNDDDEAESENEDEDESDLDLAWKMLDISRAIVEKSGEETMEKVDIYSALAEVAVEREDIESSLNDYSKALSILEHLVEPDNRRVVELNFRICLVLEIGSKIDEAIPYCAKAISLCKSRIDKLKDANELPATSKSEGKSEAVPGEEDEIELLSGVLSDLEKKLEDLEQSKLNPMPSSIVADVLKNMVAKPTEEKNLSTDSIASGSLSSPRSADVKNGFDLPTVSTSAAGRAPVTDLGVVGRGIKRAVVKPCDPEPPHKKPAADQEV